MDHSRRDFMGTAAKGLGAGAATLAVSRSSEAAESTAPSAVEGPQVAWRREVPVRYECDVAVVGGGIAGVCAALAAAKSGARVLLVERFAVVGGNATVGGVASFCGETAGQGEAFDTVIAGLEAFDAIVPYRPYPQADNRVFDHEILAIVLQELLLARGVKLLLHTQFVDVCEQDGRVTECIVSGPSGPEAVRAKQFVDCTGEAQLVRMAGLETAKGRPADGLQLPMSLMYFVRHVGEEHAKAQVTEQAKSSPLFPKDWFETIRAESDLPMTSVWPNGAGSNAIKIKSPMFDAGDTESLTAAEIRSRRRMLEVLDYHQRVAKKPWLLDHCSARIGIREGRRIVGDYVLSVDDLRAARAFDDAIARGVYYLDGHKPDDDKRTYILASEERKVPPYQIPFRSLLPVGGRNILAAGRCLSADQLAMSSARVMTTCAMMGQAAGIAAAMGAARHCDPRNLDCGEIRRSVEKRGARLEV